ADHLNRTFKTNFVVSGHPDGHKTLLKLNKESEVTHLLKTIHPYTKEVSSMKYKTCLIENIKQKTKSLKSKYGNNVNIKISSSNRKKLYTNKDIKTIIKMKCAGATDQTIANTLGRTYWSIVYKIRELRKSGKF